jgi:hypothetical protein
VCIDGISNSPFIHYGQKRDSTVGLIIVLVEMDSHVEAARTLSLATPSKNGFRLSSQQPTTSTSSHAVGPTPSKKQNEAWQKIIC